MLRGLLTKRIEMEGLSGGNSVMMVGSLAVRGMSRFVTPETRSHIVSHAR